MAKIDVGVTIALKCVIGTFCGVILKIDPLAVMMIICSEDLIKGAIYLRKYLKGDWLMHGLAIKKDDTEIV